MNLEDIEVIKFHPKHVEIAYLRERERKFFERNEEMYSKIEALQKNSFRSVTLMRDGRILTFCGFVHIAPGVAELWQIPTIYVKSAPIYYVKAIELFIDFVVEENKLRRLQTISPDDETHRSWMTFLKFEIEGTLREYGDQKENFLQWGKLIKEK